MMYQPRLEPWSHQQKALAKMEGRSAFALLCAMRTGKTKICYDDFGRLELAGEIDDLLVIAPAGVYKTWETAAQEHLSDDLQKRSLIHTWKAGALARDDRLLEQFLEENVRPRILLVNVEALSSVDRARDLCIKFLGQRRSMMAIDESATLKNWKAKRTKFVIKHLAPLAKVRRILSGLPTPRSPLDLYAQFEILDKNILGFSSYVAFMKRYAIMRPMVFGGRRIEIVDRYVNVDELKAKIEPHSYRVMLEDCYDLPPKMYSKREVRLTPEQKKAYREIKDFATTMLASGEHVTATIVIAQILRMHQVLCGHVGTEGGKAVEIPELRTAELLSLLEEYDGKAIIWASFDLDVRRISGKLEKEYGEGSVARFWGGNRGSREDEEKRFLTDPQCRFMVATAAAGGRGRTWTCADLVIYYSNSYDLEHRAQSEERAQGVNKTQSVAYVDLCVPGTVDEKIIEALRKKIDMAAVITGDNYMKWLI